LPPDQAADLWRSSAIFTAIRRTSLWSGLTETVTA